MIPFLIGVVITLLVLWDTMHTHLLKSIGILFLVVCFLSYLTLYPRSEFFAYLCGGIALGLIVGFISWLIFKRMGIASGHN